MAWCKTAVTPSLTHWDHCSLALSCQYIDGLMQKRRNSIANALESRLSCNNPWYIKWFLLFLVCKVSHCIECEKVGKYTTCRIGYEVDKSGKRHNSIANALESRLSCNNPWYIKWVLLFLVCKVSHCIECEKVGKCTTCRIGYEVDKSGKCQIACDLAHCKSCTEKGLCDTCEPNFEVKLGKCQPECKVKNCENCDLDGACIDCEDGYATFSGKCIKVCKDPNCRDCKQEGSCEKCHNDFYLDQEKKCTSKENICTNLYYIDGLVKDC